MVEQAGPEHSSLLRRILAGRNLGEQNLYAGLEALPDEGLMANIGLVAERIGRALYRNEPLAIFGHDDPDGITSTYILYNFLNSCGYQKHHYFIPNRNNFPHGIQSDLVEFVRQGGYKLVITVDNGISSYQGVEQLNALGVETIITDHHLIQPEHLPQASIILNPQLPDCAYPFKALAGVGVALMLIRYLGKILEHPVPPSSYFWTAVGSLADKVPMIGANRIIVRHVLEHWEEMQDQSVAFLLRNHNRVSSLTDRFNFVQDTARLIANGRESGGQHTALRFLIEQGDAKAGLFQDMEAQRKNWESKINQVFSMMDTISAGHSGNAFVYYDDDDQIPYSLLGTAATYILGKLGIPTIMLKQHNGDIVCEGRCSEGFNMVDAFRGCKDHLKQYGGHVKAAGFTMEPREYEGFLECFNQYVSENADADTAVLNTPDAEADLGELTPETWRELEILLPFGQQNPEPLIRVRSVSHNDLQGSFNLEHGGLAVPPGIEGNADLLWRGAQTARVIAFQPLDRS